MITSLVRSHGVRRRGQHHLDGVAQLPLRGVPSVPLASPIPLVFGKDIA